MKKRILLILLAFGFCITSYAQRTSLKIGIGMQGNLYVGDLSEFQDNFFRVSPGGNLSLQFAGRSRYQFQFNSGFGKITDQTDLISLPSYGDIEPNTFVETSFFYSDARLKFRILKNQKFEPYLSTGVGLFFFHPTDEDGNFLGENIFTRLEDEEYYRTSIPYVPATIGFEFWVSPVVSMSIDYTYRILPTDYLDNIGKLGSREGNDQLHTAQFSVYFNLNPKTTTQKTPVELPELDPNPTYAEMVSPLESLPVSKQAVAVAEMTGLANEKEQRMISRGEISEKWIKKEAEAMVHGRFLEYEVQEGEKLDEIASRYHVRKETVRLINDLESKEMLVAGQKLRLPDLGVPPEIRVSVGLDQQKKEEKLLAVRGNLERTASEKDWLRQETESMVNGDYVIYTVQKGESLGDIAKRFHVQKENLLVLNDLIGEIVYADLELRLPNMGKATKGLPQE